MSELSPVLQRAIEEALAVNPMASADDFMRDIGTAIADAQTRQAIRTAWLRAAVIAADKEGGEIPLEDAFAEMDRAIEEEAKAHAKE